VDAARAGYFDLSQAASPAGSEQTALAIHRQPNQTFELPPRVTAGTCGSSKAVQLASPSTLNVRRTAIQTFASDSVQMGGMTVLKDMKGPFVPQGSERIGPLWMNTTRMISVAVPANANRLMLSRMRIPPCRHRASWQSQILSYSLLIEELIPAIGAPTEF